MYIWQNLGMQMLIILSGLQYISEELYEAAEIDGCTTFEKFIYITVPGLKNTLVYVLVSVIIPESIHPGVCTDKRRTVQCNNDRSIPVVQSRIRKWTGRILFRNRSYILYAGNGYFNSAE